MQRYAHTQNKPTNPFHLCAKLLISTSQPARSEDVMESHNKQEMESKTAKS